LGQKTEAVILGVIMLSTFTILAGIVSSKPYDATVDDQAEYDHPVTQGGSDAAIGGNITLLNFSVNQQTGKWQGYFGNVSGEIVLEDGSGNAMYNWSWATALGEVYATTNSSVPIWFAFDDTEATVANMDLAWNFPGDEADDIADTFTETHAAFNLSGNNIAASFGPTAKTHGAAKGDEQWETVALYDGTEPANSDSYLFVGIMKDDVESFQNQSSASTVDFQLLVPERNDDGGATTTYYFYVELT
jgi:hypothetical protein